MGPRRPALFDTSPVAEKAPPRPPQHRPFSQLCVLLVFPLVEIWKYYPMNGMARFSYGKASLRGGC